MLHDIEQLNERIDENVNTNGQRAITGAILNSSLKDITNIIGKGRRFAGTLYPDNAEPDHDDSVFYLAMNKGTYFPSIPLPLEIERDGIYVVHWNFYIGKWTRELVAYETLAVAILSAQELTGKYIGDANHELLSDNNKIKAILSIRGRVYYYSEYASSDDVYVSLPFYDGDTAELSFYAMYVKRARSSSVGGYPYHIKKLTIGGVVETDV